MKSLIYLLIGVLAPAITFAAKVDTVLVESAAMRKPVKCVIIRPHSYQKSRQRLPVVYLLHGYSGNHSDWVKKVPAIKSLADRDSLMIVCPDGGYGSWYFDSPVDSSWRYETFVAKELPAYVDRQYRTIADRKHRAIAGLSMGGHGALFLAIRHQNTFGAAGSMSGGVDIRPFPKNWDIAKRLGDSATHADNWKNYSVATVAEQLKDGDLQLNIDCGVKDFFIGVNRALHQQLLQSGIAHDYTERPGAHNWQYWENAVVYQLTFFKRYFAGR
ncbi:esterase family protein [Chitinophaga horti]|uniref:Esterase family protein n=1 Tax=Chitinophaga horti TaxID=2920382 RepID=A0ABY6J6L9_9BACT|nr:alpha/beta hydrolase family protein [Chitinophaga horti]UYQ93902.1 esterase family protein [Chitinophaga horti]